MCVIEELKESLYQWRLRTGMSPDDARRGAKEFSEVFALHHPGLEDRTVHCETCAAVTDSDLNWNDQPYGDITVCPKCAKEIREEEGLPASRDVKARHIVP